MYLSEYNLRKDMCEWVDISGYNFTNKKKSDVYNNYVGGRRV